MAFCDTHMQFSVIPEYSRITYTPLSDPGNPAPTEQFDIISGSFNIYIRMAACGSIFINFESSSFITNPDNLPYGIFKLPEHVAGELKNNTFSATSYGSCGQIFCDWYNVGGTIQCVVTNFAEKISGTLFGNEIDIYGVNNIEPSYHFYIKAIRVQSSRSCFPWHILLPSFNKKNN